MFCRVHQMVAPGAKSALSDCILLYLRSPGGASGAEAGDNFAAFDTHETSGSAAQLDNMADLNIADTTLVYCVA